MSNQITIAVEGVEAQRALAELLSLREIRGYIVPAEPAEAAKDRSVLLAIGAIVGIVSGVVTVADKIIAWGENWAKGAKRLNFTLQNAKGIADWC